MAYEPRVTGSAATAELIGLFKQELDMCNLKPGEVCVVVTDTAFNPAIADAFLGAALDMGAEAYKITLPYSHPVPESSLWEGWKEADLLVYATTHGLHGKPKMREALDNGLRALMAVQPLPVLRRLIADRDVIRRTKAGAKLLEAAREIRITSDAGTDLVMDKTGRPAVANYGAADEPGHLDFWGAGMVETAQLEGTLEGTLVLDTGDIVFHLGRYIAQPVTIKFREGKAVKFEGGVDAFLIQNHLESFDDPNALMAGHTSWGTDPRALWSAQAIQFPESTAGGGDSEAHYGQVEIEIGSNNDVLFQGKNVTGAHLGLCSLNCNLYLDGRQIIDRGEFVPEELRKDA
jgi:2,5-dihydroxypyridine 5,6-dioxygenase